LPPQGKDGRLGKKRAAAARPVAARVSARSKDGAKAAASSGTAQPKGRVRRSRNAAATADRILKAAIVEFADHGYAGARIDAIALRADVNMRMLYHYFGSKSRLYVYVLESVFERIRIEEQRLDLTRMAPLPAMMKLFDFTYRHFAANPLFIRILSNENLLDGRYLSQSSLVSSLSSPLLIAIKAILRRGEAEGIFRKGIDPLQLYVSMVAMSYFHISNGPTLSHLFSTDLSSTRWRNARRRHAAEMLATYLVVGGTASDR